LAIQFAAEKSSECHARYVAQPSESTATTKTTQSRWRFDGYAQNITPHDTRRSRQMNFILRNGDDREPSLQRCIEGLSTLRKDKMWCVFVKDSMPTRTERQNALIWSIYAHIIALGGEQMQGYTKEELHEFFLELHFGVEIRSVFGRVKEVAKQRSSKLSKKEFSEFVDHIVRFMAERGVVITHPQEETPW
jgi:hypothetical protein